jgi:hypothetical protein
MEFFLFCSPFLFPFQSRLVLFSVTSFGVNRAVKFLLTATNRELADNEASASLLENHLKHGKVNIVQYRTMDFMIVGDRLGKLFEKCLVVKMLLSNDF